MHGHTFPSEFEVLNPHPEPGMMDYYLGTPKPRRSEGRRQADSNSASRGFYSGGSSDSALKKRASDKLTNVIQPQLEAAENNLFLPPSTIQDVTVPTSALGSLTIQS
jgi:hypothetical protein